MALQHPTATACQQHHVDQGFASGGHSAPSGKMCKKKKKVDLVHRVAQRCLRLTQGAAETLAEEEEEEDQLVQVLSASQFVDVVIAVKKVSWPNPLDSS